MKKLSAELKLLQEKDLLPKSSDVLRFAKPYENVGDFWWGVFNIAFEPIKNGLCSLGHIIEATWGALSVVADVVIFKPKEAASAAHNVGVNLSLAVVNALMAPINATLRSIELCMRLISSWVHIGAKDKKESLLPTKQQIDHDRTEEMAKEYQSLKSQDLLFSKTYFDKSKFFTPYQGAGDFFQGAFKPVTQYVSGGISSIRHGLHALNFTLLCLSNLLIAQPKRAGEAAHELWGHLKLSVALDLMAPLNALIQSIAFMTRLGATWYSSLTAGRNVTPPPPASQQVTPPTNAHLGAALSMAAC